MQPEGNGLVYLETVMKWSYTLESQHWEWVPIHTKNGRKPRPTKTADRHASQWRSRKKSMGAWSALGFYIVGWSKREDEVEEIQRISGPDYFSHFKYLWWVDMWLGYYLHLANLHYSFTVLGNGSFNFRKCESDAQQTRWQQNSTHEKKLLVQLRLMLSFGIVTLLYPVVRRPK